MARYRLRTQAHEEDERLWFGHGNCRGKAEQKKNPIRRAHKPRRWLATGFNADMTDVERTEQQQAKPGAEEPRGVGRPVGV